MFSSFMLVFTPSFFLFWLLFILALFKYTPLPPELWVNTHIFLGKCLGNLLSSGWNVGEIELSFLFLSFWEITKKWVRWLWCYSKYHTRNCCFDFTIYIGSKDSSQCTWGRNPKKCRFHLFCNFHKNFTQSVKIPKVPEKIAVENG